MKAWDLFSLDLLNEMLERGYVKRQQHPAERLGVFNYTPAAMYDNEWNEVTRQCRGLIIDHDGEVVARPFEKFFNWDQHGAPSVPTGVVRVGPKMDGSLGVLYQTTGGFGVATRGSFTSDQALAGTDMYNAIARLYEFEPEAGKTYLFEIIYPENRIVVDYGDKSMLVLLDVIDNETGHSDLSTFDAAMWPEKVDWKMIDEFDHRLIETIPDGEEGLVFYWHNQNVRLKMKAAEYVRLHRIITNTTKRSVWQALSEGHGVKHLTENVPDEFYEWLRKTIDGLQTDYALIQVHAQITSGHILLDVAELGGELSKAEFRKEFASRAIKTDVADILFKMLDGRSYDENIWKRLRPAHELPFSRQSEDNN